MSLKYCIIVYVIQIVKCNFGEVRKILIFYRLLEFKHCSKIKRKQRWGKWWGSWTAIILGLKCRQKFYRYVLEQCKKNISNKINIVLSTQIWSKTVKGNSIFEFIYSYESSVFCVNCIQRRFGFLLSMCIL